MSVPMNLAAFLNSRVHEGEMASEAGVSFVRYFRVAISARRRSPPGLLGPSRHLALFGVFSRDRAPFLSVPPLYWDVEADVAHSFFP